MDRLDHDIVQDLLPLYHDGVCSEKSRAAVEEHLKACETCRAALAAMDAPLPEADDAAAVQKISSEWKRSKRRAHIIGVIAAVVVCAAVAVGIWALTTWTCIPMDGEDYTLDVYRLESGGVGVHWDFREGRETWYSLTFREEEDGLHYYLERPVLRVELFNFDKKYYNRDGDAMFASWSGDAMGTGAIYFGLGEDAVLLWKEGEEVDLPAATAAQEEMWAIAELPPREVPPAEDARPRSPRCLLRLLALLLAAFALLSAVWYVTAYRPYDVYVEALRAQPGFREDPGFPECGVDGEGCTCNVARPGFLHWTGNLGIGLPALTLENGEEAVFTDSLIIWPRMTGEPELGVILYEYDVQEGGVTCTGHQLYIAPDGTYIPYGDAAEDAANQAVLAAHRENVEALLSRSREIWGIP